MQRIGDRQPATPPDWVSARHAPRRGFGLRTARWGWALARAVLLTALTGLLVAMVVATVLGGIVIAINGRLP